MLKLSRKKDEFQRGIPESFPEKGETRSRLDDSSVGGIL